jgi:hypothetical protein
MQSSTQNLILPLFVQLSINDGKGQQRLQHQFLLLFREISLWTIYGRDENMHFQQ